MAQLSNEAVSFLSGKFNERAAPDGTVPVAALLYSSNNSLLKYAPGPRSALDEKLLLSHCVVQAKRPGFLTHSGFLALWAYCTLVDPRQALKAMLFMGYRDNMHPCATQFVLLPSVTAFHMLQDKSIHISTCLC